MSFVSVGDLSRAYFLRQSNAGLRERIQKLSKEVTTGRHSDTAKQLGGDLLGLARMDRGLTEAKAYLKVASEAASTASGMQSALAHLQEIAQQSSKQMLSDALLGSEHNIRMVADTAAARLQDALSALNISVGGRFVFSGTRVDSPPLVSSDALVGMAESVVAGAANQEQALSQLQDWFDSPAGAGGFTDSAYLGANGAAAELQVDPSSKISLSQTANSLSVRRVLFGLSVAALVSRGAFAGDNDVRAVMLRAAGTALVRGNAELGLDRARLGISEEVIERARVRMNTAATTLAIERARLTEADSYAAGSQLIQAEAQLDSLYALTARLSKLSLTRYL